MKCEIKQFVNREIVEIVGSQLEEIGRGRHSQRFRLTRQIVQLSVKQQQATVDEATDNGTDNNISHCQSMMVIEHQYDKVFYTMSSQWRDVSLENPPNSLQS